MNSACDASTFPFYFSPLSDEDIPAVLEIEQQVFSLPWSEGIYRYELRHNPYATYWAVRSRCRRLPSIVAYGGVWFYLPEAHISTIAVHPRFRGFHLGAWLLAHLLLEGVKRGATEASLEVRVSNIVAQRLYLSFGFRVVGRRYRYYSDNREDAYIMTLKPLDRNTLQKRLQREEHVVRERWAQKAREILSGGDEMQDLGKSNR